MEISASGHEHRPRRSAPILPPPARRPRQYRKRIAKGIETGGVVVWAAGQGADRLILADLQQDAPFFLDRDAHGGYLLMMGKERESRRILPVAPTARTPFVLQSGQ